MKTIERILRCLKGIIGGGLVYYKDKSYKIGHQLFTFIDEVWAGDSDKYILFSDIILLFTIMLWCGAERNKRLLLDQALRRNIMP